MHTPKLSSLNLLFVIAMLVSALPCSFRMRADETNTEHAVKADVPPPVENPDKPVAPAAGQTNAPSTNAEPMKLQSVEAAAQPPMPSFADGVRFGATAARRNPDVWDFEMLLKISFGMFNQEVAASRQAQQQQLQSLKHALDKKP